MAYNVGTDGGSATEVHEPRREEFPSNLGGAVAFTIAQWLYWGTEHIGKPVHEAIKDFWAARPRWPVAKEHEAEHPFLYQLLQIADLPAPLEEQIRNLVELKVEDMGFAGVLFEGALLLMGLGASISAYAPAYQMPILRKEKYNRPDIASLIEMWYRRPDLQAQLWTFLKDLGYPDVVEDAAFSVNRPRLDFSTLINGFWRDALTEEQLRDELTKRGYTGQAVDTVVSTTRQFLPISENLTQYLRHPDTTDDVLSSLRGQGLNDQDIATLFDNVMIIPGAADLVAMAVREAFTPEIAEAFGQYEDFPPQFAYWGQKIGLTEDWCKRYWAAHWALPSPLQGFEMLHRGVIDTDDLNLLLRALDVMPYWRDKLTQIAYRPLTRVDVRRMYGLGVLTEEDVKRSYLDLGYNEENADRMTQFTILYERPPEEDTTEKYRDLTRAIIEKAYKKGIIDEPEATTKLLDLGYTIEDAAFLLSLVDMNKAIDEAPDFLKEYQKDIKGIVERAYANGIMSYEEASGMLSDVGFADTEIAYLLSAIEYLRMERTKESRIDVIGDAYVRRAIDRVDVVQGLGKLDIPSKQQEGLIANWDVVRLTRDRRLSESQYRRCLSEGFLDLLTYVDNLRGLGYTDKDIVLLVRLYNPDYSDELRGLGVR